MVLKGKQLLLLALILCLIITGCSNQRSALIEGASKNNTETSTISDKVEQKIDVLETYRNEEYNFLFDIPVSWKDNYKVIQKDNRVSFVYKGWADFEPEIFAIMVMPEEEFKKVNAEPPSIQEQDILGRRNKLVYYCLLPIAVPLPTFTATTKEEDFRKFEDEWGKLYRALNDIPKRFHFE